MAAHIELAKRHIEEIRLGLDFEGSPKVVSALTKSLNTLADELYDSSTHFLDELLQNADDNTYVSEPTISLKYQPGYLQIDNNETGFTRANVEAICDIRNSTKSHKGSSEQWTGEKGIGFKSVFKVADEVTILSGPYSFKFDKRQRFGMINPIWVDRDEASITGHTSIGLTLSPDLDIPELVQQLRSFDPKRLLFLRKLRRINIEILFSPGHSWKSSLSRSDKVNKDGSCLRTVSSEELKESFFVHKHRVYNLPQEAKRPGRTHSDLHLAFPLTGIGAALQPQKVYAHLPIHDYGLQFSLNGDFLLTANRQLIDKSSKWNIALRDALPNAFMEAIRYFAAEKGPMMFAWPNYIPIKARSFFQPALLSILPKIRDAQILRSSSKGSRDTFKPETLVYVDPERYTNDDGAPFTLKGPADTRYLSPEYPAHVVAPLCELGVRRMTDEQFLFDLESMIVDDRDAFWTKPTHWHSRLATALLPLAAEPHLLKKLQSLPIIPLANGGPWESGHSTCRPFFLHNPQSSAHFTAADFSTQRETVRVAPQNVPKVEFSTKNLPSGLEIVHQDAIDDNSRRALLIALGIETINVTRVCEHICSSHASRSFNPDQWTVEQLLSHATYLYQANWRPPNGINLWFATSGGGRAKGSTCYFAGASVGPPNSTHTRIFEKLKSCRPIIHDAYLADSTTGWRTFLIASLHLSAIPRLIQRDGNAQEGPFEICDDFRILFRDCAVADILRVLCDNWQDYSVYLEPGPTNPDEIDPVESKRRLVQTIKEFQVDTLDGSSKLSETILRGVDSYLDEKCPNLPVLDVGHPVDNPMRRKLALFHISVEAGLDYYLSCLRYLRTLREGPDEKIVSHIYGQLQARYDDNDDVRDTTNKVLAAEDLVYIKSISPKTTKPIGWCTLHECMQRNIDLESEYPQSKDLFKWLLAHGKVNIKSPVARALLVSKACKLSEILGIFKDISSALEDMSKASRYKAIKPLLMKPIFPVSLPGSVMSYDRLATHEDLSWFIGDRPHLRKSFEGKIPLLAFSVRDIEDINVFLQTFGVESRTLSKNVSSKTSPKGTLSFSRSSTLALHARLPFINLLISGSKSEKDRIMKTLASCTVFIATRIDRVLELRVKDAIYKGRPVRGYAHAILTDDVLKIFLAEEDSRTSRSFLCLADTLARFCNIERNDLHSKLLYMALSDKSLSEIQADFEFDGFSVTVDTKKGGGKTKSKASTYAARSGHKLKIPNPWLTRQDDDDDESDDNGVPIESTGETRKVADKRMHDRRIEMMPIESSEQPPTAGLVKCTDLDPNDTLQFVGQYATSIFFEENLRGHFQPKKHWISEIRTRAGLDPPNPSRHGASFTFSDHEISKAFTDFLFNEGYAGASLWANHSPKYHFIVAPSAGDWRVPFAWTTDYLEMMRNLQLSRTTVKKPKDVLVLIRISSIYTEPCFHFFVDPWSLVTAGHFTLPETASFQAVIDPLSLALSDMFEIPEDTYRRQIIKKYDMGVHKYAENDTKSQNSDKDVDVQLTFVNGFKTAPHFDKKNLATSISVSQLVSSATLGIYGANKFPSSWHSSSPSAPHNSGIFQVRSPGTECICPRCKVKTQNIPIRPSQEPKPPPKARQVFPPNFPPSASFNPGIYYPGNSAQFYMSNATQFPQLYPMGTGYFSNQNTMAFNPVMRTEIPQTHANWTNYTGSYALNESTNRSRPNAIPIRKPQPDPSPHPKNWSLRQWIPDDDVSYSYSPLKTDRFRLFVLFPGDKEAAISGAICEHDLDGSTPYQSLSYTWGPPNQQTHRIWTPGGHVHVKESLHAVLKRLRPPEGPLVLWIDAICINQSNDLEKRDQIRLLPRIFQGATCTLALVGADENSDAAIEMLMQVRAKQVYGLESDEWPKNLKKPAHWIERSMPPPNDSIWQWVEAFFNRDWFRRAWIVQEAIAAPTVQMVCGKWSIDWNDLFFAMELVEKELEETENIDRDAWKPFMTLSEMREYQARGDSWSLFLLLETFRHVKATLMRDRFFSLLGLASDGNLQEFDPDYSSTTSFEEIVCRFAGAFVSQGYGIQMLHRAGMDAHRGRFPSWIPDWTSQKPDSISSDSWERGNTWAASGDTVPDISVLPGAADTICVRGIMADEITHISRSSNQTKEPSRLAQYFKEIDSMIDTHLEKGWTPTSRNAVKWRVPIADAQNPKIATAGDVNLHESYKALRKVLKSIRYHGAKEAQYLTQDGSTASSSPETEETTPGVKEKSLSYYNALQDKIEGWRFFTTKNGLCGIAPWQAEVGDAICVVAGGDIPFLMRKSTHTEAQKYWLIGECYTFGMMRGQALQGMEDAWGIVELH